MIEQALRDLMTQMTLEEKIGQLVQLDGGCYGAGETATGPRQKLGLTQKMVDMSGSVLNVLGAEKVRDIQTRYLERSRLKIPLLFMADIIYGYKTVFPIPLGLGCTWEPELIYKDYKIIAEESQPDGGMVTFSPPVDLIRDARWGRCMESPGEDPWLNTRYADAMVRGLQDGLDEGRGIASCVKHFAAYGAVEAGREYNTVDMSERKLRQDYLTGYKAAVDAGAKLVMTSFNTIDGIPVTANQWILNDLLRGEWGFDGVIITDYAAIQELKAHGVAADDREAAELAINATVDIDMKTSCYAAQLEPIVRDGRLDEHQIDAACWRVLRLKNELGLFENPFRGADAVKAAAEADKPAHVEAARVTARKAMVLLKNKDGVLPLATNGKKIALIGPYADSTDIIGMWAIHADRSRVQTLRTVMERELGRALEWTPGCVTIEDLSMLGEFGNIPAFQGTSADEATAAEWEREALELAEKSDVLVLAMGEHMLQSGEAGSRTDIRLPECQTKLLKKLHACGKPVVLVLFNGRPLDLTDIEPYCDAILDAWFPGTAGGEAVCDLLFGNVEPTGRLTTSFPRSVGQLPLYYNSFNTGRPIIGSGHSGRFTSHYLDCPNDPLYPFGFGLSYHTAEYGVVTLDKNVLRCGEMLTASVTVTNTSDRVGTETVQWYLRDFVGSVVRPVKELKGFERVSLAPGESKTVNFTITEELLRFYTKSMKYESEAGKFAVMAGPNSQQLQIAEFVLKE